MIRRALPLAAVAAAVLALSACGDTGGGYGAADPYGSIGGGSAPAGPAPTGIPRQDSGYGGPPAGPPASADGSGADDPVLAAKEVADVGTVLTDAEGYTLYRFDEDTAQPPTATCVEACAEKWPPVVVDPQGTLELDGVERDAIGLVARPDGATQLTVGGWPVYRYAQDPEPGVADGEGVGGTWHAVAPDGGKAAG
jgi:predicted lipoprotein with Yx(FWY)xxD motif